MSNQLVFSKIDEINKVAHLDILSHPSSVQIFKNQFKEKADTWLQRERSYLVQIFSDDKVGPALKACTTFSLQGAITSIISNGLSLDPALGQAFLIPYKKTVKVMYGYKGKEQMLVDEGVIQYVEFCDPVYSCDKFRRNMGRIIEFEQPNERPKDATIIGGCIRVRLGNGQSKDLYLTKAEIDKRMEASQSKGKYGPWKDWLDEMVKKTMIHAIYKTLPKRSAKVDEAIEQEEYVQDPDVTATYEEVPESDEHTEHAPASTEAAPVKITENKDNNKDEDHLPTEEERAFMRKFFDSYDVPVADSEKLKPSIETISTISRLNKMKEYIEKTFQPKPIGTEEKDPIESFESQSEAGNNDAPF